MFVHLQNFSRVLYEWLYIYIYKVIYIYISYIKILKVYILYPQEVYAHYCIYYNIYVVIYYVQTY